MYHRIFLGLQAPVLATLQGADLFVFGSLSKGNLLVLHWADCVLLIKVSLENAKVSW